MSVSIGNASGVGYYCGGGGGGEDERPSSYYLGAVAQGEPAGYWQGRLAAELGLDGEVTAAAMTPLFTRFEAPDGTRLGRAAPTYKDVETRLAQWAEAHHGALPEDLDAARRAIEATQREAVMGQDLTFSPPKSVTVAHTAAWRAEVEAAQAGDEAGAAAHRAVRECIEAAVLRANAAAMAYASTVTTSRAGSHSGAGGGHWVAAPDLVIASFHQHTARPVKGADGVSIDPQQHVHNVVLNRARGDDGQLRALDTRDLTGQRAGISAVADRVLADEMARIGLPMAMRPDGLAREVVGVPQDVMDLFSQRRRVITERMAPLVDQAEQVLGRSLTDMEVSRIARDVTLFSRVAKTGTEGDWATHLEDWQQRMREELGRGLVPLAEQLRAASEAARDAQQEPVTFSPDRVRNVALEAVQAAAGRSGTWNRADLLLEVERALPVLPQLSPAESTLLLKRLTDEALAQHATQVAGIDDLPSLGEDTPGLGFVRPSARRYAAPSTVEGEQRIREAAVQRGGHALSRQDVARWLDANAAGVGADQRAAVEGIASSDAMLSVLVGPAGTGKTYAMGALAGVWAELSGGGRVQGLTVTDIASTELQRDGVDVAANTARWLAAQNRIASGRMLPGDEAFAVRREDVLLVDEASMVGTAQLDRIREIAGRAGARILLAGDGQQLQAVEAGGALELLDGRAETYTLTEVRRFAADWERQASLRLRERDPAVLAEYDRHGRILPADDVADAIAQAARAAAADRIAGLETLGVAGTNETASAFSRAIREHLVSAGLVDQDGVQLGLDGGVAGVGDEVMARQVDRGLGVQNRQRFTVTGVEDDGGLRVVDRDGVERTLPAGYVAEHVQSGYASTAHAAQGVTVDRAHWVTDGRDEGYVPMSRGRDRNTAYVAVTRPDTGLEAGDVEVSEEQRRASAVAALQAAMAREDDPRSALVAAEQDEAHRRGMAQLLARQEVAAQIACRDRLERHLDDLAAEGLLSTVDRARLCAEQGTDHLSRLLRGVEQAGNDPREALRAALEGRGLADAVSVSQVLSHRLSGRHDLADAVPGRDLPDDIGEAHRVHLEAIRERIADRERALGGEVAQEPPAWAVQALGDVPQDAVERLEWEARAGRVAAYREATGWSDDARAIDHAPGVTTTERRAAWHEAWEALGRPEATREEAALSDGRLQARAAAWEREQAWAPPYADDAMRENEQAAERARVDAVHARAQGDEDAAAARETEADRLAAVARDAERVADGRAAWAAATAETRAVGERAAAELDARGLAPGREPDRVTAEEWLAADRQAREADDAHRSVTDADVEDDVRDEVIGLDRGREVDDAQHLDLGREPDEGSAHERLDVAPSPVELDIAVEQAAAAQDRALDYASQEAAHVDQAPSVEVADEARTRKVADA